MVTYIYSLCPLTLNMVSFQKMGIYAKAFVTILLVIEAPYILALDISKLVI